LTVICNKNIIFGGGVSLFANELASSVLSLPNRHSLSFRVFKIEIGKIERDKNA